MYNIPHFTQSLTVLTNLESLNVIGFAPNNREEWDAVLRMPNLQHLLLNEEFAYNSIAQDDRYKHVEFMSVGEYTKRVNSIYGFFEKGSTTTAATPPPRSDLINDWY